MSEFEKPKATVGDLVFYRPQSRAREAVPILAGADDMNQTGVMRVLSGDVIEIVTQRAHGWLLGRYPKTEGVLLINADYCEVWKRAEVRTGEV